MFKASFTWYDLKLPMAKVDPFTPALIIILDEVGLSLVSFLSDRCLIVLTIMRPLYRNPTANLNLCIRECDYRQESGHAECKTRQPTHLFKIG